MSIGKRRTGDVCGQDRPRGGESSDARPEAPLGIRLEKAPQGGDQEIQPDLAAPTLGELTEVRCRSG